MVISNLHVFIGTDDSISVISIESWEICQSDQAQIKGDDTDGAQQNDNLVIFPTTGSTGCPAYSDISGQYQTSLMPEQNVVWRIKMCLNNTRAVALITTFDGTIKLLEMQCLKSPKMYKWHSVFKPWFTIFNNNQLIGMYGANNSISIQKMDLDHQGRIQAEMSDRNNQYKALHMMKHEDVVYTLAIRPDQDKKLVVLSHGINGDTDRIEHEIEGEFGQHRGDDSKGKYYYYLSQKERELFLYQIDVKKYKMMNSWQINAPIDSNILYGKIKSNVAVTSKIFITLMENYMLWFDLNIVSNGADAKNVHVFPIQSDYEKVTQQLNFIRKKVVETASYKKDQGHKTEFRIWHRISQKVIHKFKLPGRCDLLYPLVLNEGNENEMQLMLIAQYDEQKELTTYWALNLSNDQYEMGTILFSKHENQRFMHVTEDERLIFCVKPSEHSCFAIEVNLKEAVGYAFYDHMTKIKNLSDTPKYITFAPELSEIMLFPSMIRLTHVYTVKNAISALKHALKAGMNLGYTADSVNEMMLAQDDEEGLLF